MFKKKKEGNKSNDDHKKELANMLGGLGMDAEDMTFGMDIDGDDSDDDNASLEAELAALQGEVQHKRKKKQMGDDDDDDDDDLDNPELLAELQSIAPGEDVLSKNDPTPVMQPSKVQPPQESFLSSSVLDQLQAREKMYQTAIANAEKCGETSKAKRYGRGLKQVEQMIKQCKAGKAVNLDELAPEVATGSSASSQPPAPSIPQPTETPKVEVTPRNDSIPQNITATKDESKEVKNTSSAEKEQTIAILKTRQNQYKVAALTCKRSGNIAQAKQFLVVSKQIGAMMESVSNDQDVDISTLPPEPTLASPAKPKPETESRQQSGSPTSEPQPGPSTQPDQPSQSNNMGIPPPPKDVNEALQQRLEKYQQAANKAKEEGNSSKARRMGRIVKQYEDAIKAYKAGRHVDFEELPTPPGFEDIPLPGNAAPKPSAQAEGPATTSEPQALKVRIPQPAAQMPPQQQHGSLNRQGRNEQQLNFLLERQKEFKTAALKAKKQGDIEEAKKWLRMSKGLDPMIENASNGMRVDLLSVPLSPLTSQGPAPTASANFVMIETKDCMPNPRTPEEITELYARLEDCLIKQTEMCIKNGKHYQQLGDLSSAKMYDKMAKSLHQDLDAVKSAKKHKDPPPKFHYEDKTFTVVNSFSELSNSEVEIEVVRCLNVPLPSGYSAKDMYTYVAFEFPYPNVSICYIRNSQTHIYFVLEYNESFKVNIDRKNRTLARIFKRQNLKFEVKYERGFLKGDKAIGQAQIKLAPFDSKCEIHECIDLMDTDRGRKGVGGKLEVRVRIREPLTGQDVQMEKWKWLVIDMHLGGKKTPDLDVGSIMAKTSPTPGRAVTQGSINDLVSVEVLKMEKQLAERQASAQKAKGQTPSPALLQRYKQCSQKMEQLQTMLSKADKKILENYVHQLVSQIKVEQSNAQRALQAGNKTEAHLCNTRKKLMQNEIISFKPKLGLK
ncbi:coiled-coil and C2 domain-containing protein 1-like [Actinia tenebrosa]|uniref:Coiled-coil and C2 domain-containing protein 1-like n=1 Tax=Actinia tenebrosa TaxID=6105 RepID=A0A6P8H547_ACTTE|nr:coiled-coil and C2 domain-containing protein 1-like [Actinia tenebrosa]